METKQESGSAELVLKKLMEHSQGREQAVMRTEESVWLCVLPFSNPLC